MKLRRQIPLLADDECYLDNAATALMPQSVLDAVHDYDACHRGNVGGRGLHRFAEAADEAYSAARGAVAAMLSTAPDEVVFTAGSTAALNLLAMMLGDTMTPHSTLLLSVAEHHSNIVPWQIAARRRGFAIRFFNTDEFGAPDAAAAIAAIDQHRPAVVSVAHVSNVSGGIADIPAIAAAAKNCGAVVVVDGAQFTPHQLPDLSALGADFYVFSGHKCYAPNGIGVLWGRAESLARLPPAIGGGGGVLQVLDDRHTPAELPQRLEPGTPPITPAVGLAQAMRWRRDWPPDTADAVIALAETMRRGLAAIPGVRLLFPAAAPIVSFTVDDVHPHDVCEWLAMQGVAVRGGHHCAQPFMRRLQINGCVRASIAPYNNEGDIAKMLAAVEEAAAKLQ